MSVFTVKIFSIANKTDIQWALDIKYVDATHLYNDFEADCYHFGGCNLRGSAHCLNQCSTHEILQRIEQMRSLKVRENIHAKWITRKQQSYGYVCSRCLREAYDKGNFCSYCGAYMVEEEKEENDLSNE